MAVVTKILSNNKRYIIGGLLLIGILIALYFLRYYIAYFFLLLSLGIFRL